VALGEGAAVGGSVEVGVPAAAPPSLVTTAPSTLAEPLDVGPGRRRWCTAAVEGLPVDEGDCTVEYVAWPWPPGGDDGPSGPEIATTAIAVRPLAAMKQPTATGTASGVERRWRPPALLIDITPGGRDRGARPKRASTLATSWAVPSGAPVPPGNLPTRGQRMVGIALVLST
jgi:hypothetical protein